jgi:tetratricopeptide (TPR) repeat protein
MTTGSLTAGQMYSEGTVLMHKGEYAEAISTLTEAIRLNPNMVAAYRTRAECLSRIDRHAEGETDMRKADDLSRPRYNSGDVPINYADDDNVGAGRYVLSFLLLGIPGLIIQYFMRRKGWDGVGVIAALMVLVIILLAASGLE